VKFKQAGFPLPGAEKSRKELHEFAPRISRARNLRAEKSNYTSFPPRRRGDHSTNKSIPAWRELPRQEDPLPRQGEAAQGEKEARQPLEGIRNAVINRSNYLIREQLPSGCRHLSSGASAGCTT
jgi:hypothetical protein